MPIKTISSREFLQTTSRAQREAEKGPVFITKRGNPAFVLLSIAEYERMTVKGKSIADLLAMPEGTPEFDFDPPRLGDIAKEVDLS